MIEVALFADALTLKDVLELNIAIQYDKSRSPAGRIAISLKRLV
jgi:hypothetical protein